MPTPSANPPSVMMLSVRPPSAMITNVTKIEIGIAVPMMSVPRTLPRKKYTTSIASTAPVTAVSVALRNERRT